MAKKQEKPKEYTVIFEFDFEGHINNHYISAKKGEKRKVNKLIYDFVKKHGVIK